MWQWLKTSIYISGTIRHIYVRMEPTEIKMSILVLFSECVKTLFVFENTLSTNIAINCCQSNVLCLVFTFIAAHCLRISHQP